MNFIKYKAIVYYIFLLFVFLFCLTKVKLVCVYSQLNIPFVEITHNNHYLGFSGWFNYKEPNLKYHDSFNYIHQQYLVAPAILENGVWHDKIICYFSDLNQLQEFMNEHKEYQLKNITNNLTVYFEKKQ